jgi:hypothetical protein
MNKTNKKLILLLLSVLILFIFFYFAEKYIQSDEKFKKCIKSCEESKICIKEKSVYPGGSVGNLNIPETKECEEYSSTVACNNICVSKYR